MSKKEKVEFVFEEQGLLDDKCAKCCRGCCCRPPPFRVAIVPVLFLLAIFIAMYVVFWLDATGLCATRSNEAPTPECRLVSTTVGNLTTETAVCPPEDHPCYYLRVANVSIADWSMFFIIAIAGFAILRAIVSIVWWITRGISGKHGVAWAYVKPLDEPVHWLIWNFLFFIIYNRYFYFATPLLYTVCDALSQMILIFTIVLIIASLLATFITRWMSHKSRKAATKFRAKAKLIDGLIKNEDKSLVDVLTLGMTNVLLKTAKNVKKTALASAEGDDVVVELKSSANSEPISDAEIKAVWDKFAGKNLTVDKATLSKAAGVDGLFAKDLWAIFSEDPKGTIYQADFAFGIRSVERGLKDTVSELQNRAFLGSIVSLIVWVIFVIIGVIIALDSIDLQLAVLLTALSVFTLAAGMILSGVFGDVLKSFIFLLTAKPYYVNDVVVINGDPLIVKKITLFCTFGFHPDGRWMVYSNTSLAGSRIINLTRSLDAVHTIEAVVSVATTKKQLATWHRTIKAYIASKPEVWKDLAFVTDRIDGENNKMVIVMKAFSRGANWSRVDLWIPAKSELLDFIRRSANQLGIHYIRSIQPTVGVSLPPVEAETALVDLKAESEDDEEVESSSSEIIEKKAKKSKSKSEKKDK